MIEPGTGVYCEQPTRAHVRLGEWPSGEMLGGWLCGDVEAGRAADLPIEDYVGPPNHMYARYWGGAHSDHKSMEVVSTHTETHVYAHLTNGMRASYFTFKHPDGLR